MAFKFKYKIDYGSAERTAIKKIGPSPAEYGDTTRMNKAGRYDFNSEWNNSKAARWSPAKGTRFRDSLQNIPGPGSYENHGEMANPNAPLEKQGI